MWIFTLLLSLLLLSLQAITGQAYDRHFLGLRLIAKQHGISMPAIFNDPNYAESLHYRVSTSQVGTCCSLLVNVPESLCRKRMPGPTLATIHVHLE